MRTISIVSPVLNAEAYIRQTIESVIYQSGDFNIEYIIVDGGSTDSTLEICRTFLDLSSNDSRFNSVKITLLSEPDEGMYDALSKGLSRVTGDIVAYLNASDFYLPNAFSAVCKVFDNNPAVSWLTGFNTFATPDGVIFDSVLPFKYQRKWISKYVYGGVIRHIQQESTFWLASLNDQVDLSRLAAQRYAGDYYLWCCFAKHHELDVVHALLGCFRVHSEQRSSDIELYNEEARLLSCPNNINTLNPYYYVHIFMWGLPNKAKRFFNPEIFNILKYK